MFCCNTEVFKFLYHVTATFKVSRLWFRLECCIFFFFTCLSPGWRRSPGGGNPLHYSCLKKPMDREGWQATVHGVANNRTQLKWLSMHALSLMFCPLFVYNSGAKHSALNVLMCHNEKELCSLSHISLLLSFFFLPCFIKNVLKIFF